MIAGRLATKCFLRLDRARELPLSAGDRLALYTDGITEAPNGTTKNTARRVWRLGWPGIGSDRIRPDVKARCETMVSGDGPLRQ